jgi:hypothetical protein
MLLTGGKVVLEPLRALVVEAFPSTLSGEPGHEQFIVSIHVASQ